jgi:hypothetical protein
MRDLYNKLAAQSVIADATIAADNTPATINLAGFDSAMLAISVGVGGITFTTTNKIEFVLTHSNDDTTYTAVAQSDVQGVTVTGAGIVLSLTAIHAAQTVTRVGYIGNCQYLKLMADFSGTHGTGTPISALLLQSAAKKRPV